MMATSVSSSKHLTTLATADGVVERRQESTDKAYYQVL